MHPAKRFFYVSLGILALAVAFQLGAHSVRAQGSGTIEGAAIQWVQGAQPEPIRASGVVNRLFSWMDSFGNVHTYSVPVPGSSRVIATDPAGMEVMLENGDVYRFTGTEWRRLGNLMGSPIPTQPTTWGRVKAERR